MQNTSQACSNAHLSLFLQIESDFRGYDRVNKKENKRKNTFSLFSLQNLCVSLYEKRTHNTFFDTEYVGNLHFFVFRRIKMWGTAEGGEGQISVQTVIYCE